MRYSLLNRFRGALLGSLLGEMLGSSSYQESVFNKCLPTPPKSRDSKPIEAKIVSYIPSDWSQIATCGIESLIDCGRLDAEDWVIQAGKRQPSLALLKSTASSHEAAVATLPIALFFHDDQIKLRQQLLCTIWQRESQECEGILAVGYAIALALTEKLDCANLIPEILAYLGTTQTPLVQQLEQVQILIEQGAGLDTTLTQLRRAAQLRGESVVCANTSIALSFYCFLSTPEDFRLCVTRAAHCAIYPQISATITGALAGAYNSNIGIPVGWRLALNRIGSGVERLQIADRLLAVWSGVYHTWAIESCQWAAIAAPRVIQRRA